MHHFNSIKINIQAGSHVPLPKSQPEHTSADMFASPRLQRSKRLCFNQRFTDTLIMSPVRIWRWLNNSEASMSAYIWELHLPTIPLSASLLLCFYLSAGRFNLALLQYFK